MKRFLGALLAALLALALLAGCAPHAADAPTVDTAAAALDRNGSYTTKDDVALYLYQYGELPQNFITKAEARALGWDGGGLEDVAPGKCIGGDSFGNFEGLLPKAGSRTYFECDINTLGADSRGPERLVYSSDGLIYYTANHYASFTLLFGETPQPVDISNSTSIGYPWQNAQIENPAPFWRGVFCSAGQRSLSSSGRRRRSAARWRRC